MGPARILDGLNPQQRAAAETTRGPLCILAGAGTGKTTTIAHRIAYQVATGAFAAGEILAVTFTDKAAGEMGARLRSLGVEGVRTRTFHASALAQLHHLVPKTGEILASKGLWLRQIANRLPKAYRFRPVADLATEIEWARNRRLTPDTYLESLGTHEPPIPADLMERVFRSYEQRKRREGRIDFEDVLELLIQVYQERPPAIERFRRACRAITVDEYQDVNLLQQTLLDLWLGDRDELCVVGDDYQSIYSFTGGTSAYLLDLPRRFVHAIVIRLETNYRSSCQVLAVANRLVPRLAGADKELRSASGDGPEPVLRETGADEARWVAGRVLELHRTAEVPYEEMAVLYRVNARSEDYEEALAAAGVPYQVRGSAFLARPAARSVLRRVPQESAAATVRAAVEAEGLLAVLPGALGEEEETRQADLRRLVQLAAAFGEGGAADFAADLERRFGQESSASGVHLLTYHRAKGLEWDAVFLPRLVEGELPHKQARDRSALAEERRLLYVGLTRARRYLFLTWPAGSTRSRYLAELGAEELASPEVAPAADGPAFEALKAWRAARSKADGLPAYVVFHDRTVAELAARLPRDRRALAAVPGLGPAKAARYGEEVLGVLAAFADSARP